MLYYKGGRRAGQNHARRQLDSGSLHLDFRSPQCSSNLSGKWGGSSRSLKHGRENNSETDHGSGFGGNLKGNRCSRDKHPDLSVLEADVSTTAGPIADNHPPFPPFASSLHAGAHLRRHGAPRFGDAGAALVGLTVGGRTDSDFEALGKRRGWRDQNRKLQWLRAVTNRARALHACMAGTDAFRPRWGFCFPIPQGGGPCSRFRVYFRRPPTRKGRRRCCRVTVELNFPPSLDSSAPFWYHRPASGLAGPR